MATTGRQFMQKYESNWFWRFWSLPSIQMRCVNRNNTGKPSLRALLRKSMAEFPVFKMIVNRLLERKQKKDNNANVNHVLDTIISSYNSYFKNSRF